MTEIQIRETEERQVEGEVHVDTVAAGLVSASAPIEKVFQTRLVASRAHTLPLLMLPKGVQKPGWAREAHSALSK